MGSCTKTMSSPFICRIAWGAQHDAGSSFPVFYRSVLGHLKQFRSPSRTFRQDPSQRDSPPQWMVWPFRSMCDCTSSLSDFQSMSDEGSPTISLTVDEDCTTSSIFSSPPFSFYLTLYFLFCLYLCALRSGLKVDCRNESSAELLVLYIEKIVSSVLECPSFSVILVWIRRSPSWSGRGLSARSRPLGTPLEARVNFPACKLRSILFRASRIFSFDSFDAIRRIFFSTKPMQNVPSMFLFSLPIPAEDPMRGAPLEVVSEFV